MELELIITFISLIFIGIGIVSWQKGNHLSSIGKKVNAIIIKNNYKQTDTNNGCYYPVVRFATLKKKIIIQELNIGYQPAKPIGKKVEILYDPENPHNVEINSIFQLVIIPRLFTALGITGFVFGLLEYLELSHLL